MSEVEKLMVCFGIVVFIGVGCLLLISPPNFLRLGLWVGAKLFGARVQSIEWQGESKLTWRIVGVAFIVFGVFAGSAFVSRILQGNSQSQLLTNTNSAPVLLSNFLLSMITGVLSISFGCVLLFKPNVVSTWAKRFSVQITFDENPPARSLLILRIFGVLWITIGAAAIWLATMYYQAN